MENRYYIVAPNITLRSSSYEPLTVSISGKDNNNGTINKIISYDDELFGLNNLAIMETIDDMSIICCGSPFISIAKSLFTALTKKIGISNISTIIAVDENNFKNSINELLKITYTESGLIGFIKLNASEKIKEFKLNENVTNDIKLMLDNLIVVWNLIKQVLGMRQNENFMSDRNIKLGMQQANIVFSFFEKSVEEAIQFGIEQVQEKFGWKNAILKKHVEIKTDLESEVIINE